MALTPIYVVSKQVKNNIGVIVNQTAPDKLFWDYPSALAYATSIFVKNFMNSDMSARDLIWLGYCDPSQAPTSSLPVTQPTAPVTTPTV